MPTHPGFHAFAHRSSTDRRPGRRRTCRPGCSGCDSFASVPEGHAPFAVFNRTANPVVRAVLSSPFHPLLSRNLALITVTGRRTGRRYTFPVGYRQDGDRVLINVGLARAQTLVAQPERPRSGGNAHPRHTLCWPRISDRRRPNRGDGRDPAGLRRRSAGRLRTRPALVPPRASAPSRRRTCFARRGCCSLRAHDRSSTGCWGPRLLRLSLRCLRRVAASFPMAWGPGVARRRGVS